MNNLPNKDILINDLNLCWNNEEKLIYIMDLGKNLPLNKENIRKKKYIIYKCQSNIWIKIKKKKNILNINCDSNSLIIKGWLAIILSIYRKKKIKKNMKYKILSIIKKISLFKKLTFHKLTNLKFILFHIEKKILNLQKKNKNKLIIK